MRELFEIVLCGKLGRCACSRLTKIRGALRRIKLPILLSELETLQYVDFASHVYDYDHGHVIETLASSKEPTHVLLFSKSLLRTILTHDLLRTKLQHQYRWLRLPKPTMKRKRDKIE